MADTRNTSEQQPQCDVAICFDPALLHRLRPVIRHLSVGLIDLVGSVRLISSTPEIQELALGPVKTLVHKPPHWFQRRRAVERLIEQLQPAPPTIVHAISAGAIDVAQSIATAFDIDMVFQVTSLDDIPALSAARHGGPQKFICSSQPLLDQCVHQGVCAEDDARLIRPGVTCRDEPTCFVDASRDPTVLSTSAFVEEEGVAALIDAVHLLTNRGHKFLTFLLGSGPLEHALRKRVQSLQLDRVVTFAQPSGHVLSAMVGADIYVHPAAGRAISARSIQALGQGAAVVSVQGGVLDALIADRTAMLCETGSADNLAKAIERLLIDQDMARRLASGAIEYMRTHHTMSRMAELTANVYREMLLEHATFKMKRKTTP